MWPFKRIHDPSKGWNSTADIAKVGENLNFGNNPNIPIFWYDLINYTDILIGNNLELQFTINNENNKFCCRLYYIIGNYEHCIDCVDEYNYEQYIQIFCEYNIIWKETRISIAGLSYEIFRINNIKYKKHIIIEFDDSYEDDLLSHIQKIIKENPDYNFTKFNDNGDIKIAIKN